MTTKCLLVCENGVITAGVQSLLAEQSDLEVLVISASINKELAQTVEKQRPATVILDEEVRKKLPIQLWETLVNLPDLQIIIFNQKNNMLHIHQNEWTEQAHVQNLGTVIRSRGEHSHPS